MTSTLVDCAVAQVYKQEFAQKNWCFFMISGHCIIPGLLHSARLSQNAETHSKCETQTYGHRHIAQAALGNGVSETEATNLTPQCSAREKVMR